MHLPPIESPSYMKEWAIPGSATRLKKMANSIASFARQAKRRRNADMREAVQSSGSPICECFTMSIMWGSSASAGRRSDPELSALGAWKGCGEAFSVTPLAPTLPAVSVFSKQNFFADARRNLHLELCGLRERPSAA